MAHLTFIIQVPCTLLPSEDHELCWVFLSILSLHTPSWYKSPLFTLALSCPPNPPPHRQFHSTGHTNLLISKTPCSLSLILWLNLHCLNNSANLSLTHTLIVRMSSQADVSCISSSYWFKFSFLWSFLDVTAVIMSYSCALAGHRTLNC